MCVCVFVFVCVWYGCECARQCIPPTLSRSCMGVGVCILYLQCVILYSYVHFCAVQCTVLMGMHGAGMSNAIFCPEGGAMIHLEPYKMFRFGASFYSPVRASTALQVRSMSRSILYLRVDVYTARTLHSIYSLSTC